MELSFDHNGYLKPYQRIDTTLENFETFFIDAFQENATRRQIFRNYQEFLSDFSTEICDSFIQWIDGSFISTKTNPKDIDFVTIIDHEIFQKKESLIEEKFRLRGAKQKYQVDAYTIRRYPVGHKKHVIFQNELVYWDNWFSWTKKNRAKKKFRKGYVSIQFGDFQL